MNRTRRYGRRRQAKKRQEMQQARQSARQQDLPRSLEIITADSLRDGQRPELTPRSNPTLGSGLPVARPSSEHIIEDLWQSHSEDFTFDLEADDIDSADVLLDIAERADKDTTAVLFRPVVAPITEAPELVGATVLPRPVVPVIDIQPQTEVYEGPELLSDDDTLGAAMDFGDAVDEDAHEVASRREPKTEATVRLLQPAVVAAPPRRLLLVLVFVLGVGVGVVGASWDMLSAFYQDQWQLWRASVTAPAGAVDVLDDSAPAINE